MTAAAVRALIRRPARTTQLEALLDRYRWANAGLRERLAHLDAELTLTLDALEGLADSTARTLGHLHPVVTILRAVVEEARRP